MIHVRIEDMNTNEVIYDREVSMVIMQAAAENRIRSIRHASEGASLNDVLNCVEAARGEASKSSDLLLKALGEAFSDDDESGE